MTDPKRSNREIARELAECGKEVGNYTETQARLWTRIEKALNEAEKEGFITGHNDGYKQGIERGAAEMRERAASRITKKRHINEAWNSALSWAAELINTLPLSPSEKDGEK